MIDEIFREIDSFNGIRIRCHRNEVTFIYDDEVHSYDTSKLSNTECGLIVSRAIRKMGSPRVIPV